MSDLKITLQELFKNSETWLLAEHDKNKAGIDLSAFISENKLRTLTKKMLELKAHLEDISVAEVKEGFLVTYHYAFYSEQLRLAIRLISERGASVISISNIYQGAQWHEREAQDFFGISFLANPNPIALLLPEDFQGAPPLLKSEESLSSLCDFNLFGSIIFLNDNWHLAKMIKELEAKDA